MAPVVAPKAPYYGRHSLPKATKSPRFEPPDEIIHYSSAPRVSSGYLGSTTDSSLNSSPDSKHLGRHYQSLYKHKVIPDIKPRNAALALNADSKSISGHRNPEIHIAFGKRSEPPEREEDEYNRRLKFVNKKTNFKQKQATMPPNPRSQSQAGSDDIIAGHKISLNVPYNKEKSVKESSDEYNDQRRRIMAGNFSPDGQYTDFTPVMIDEQPALREFDDAIASAQRSSPATEEFFDNATYAGNFRTTHTDLDCNVQDGPVDIEGNGRDMTINATEDRPLTAANSMENFVDAAEDLGDPAAMGQASAPEEAIAEAPLSTAKVVSESEAPEALLVSSASRSASPLGEIRSESPLQLESNSPHSSSTASVDGETYDKTEFSYTHFSSTAETENLAVNAADSMVAQQEYLDGPDQVVPATSHKTWLPNGAVKLQIAEEGLASHKPLSVPSLLRKTAEKYPNQNALVEKRNGEWVGMTYANYYKQVRNAARGFIKLGLDAYHGVCILGFNSSEWFISDLGAIFAGGFAAGIYTTNSPEACQHCALNCEAQIFVVEDKKQLEKVLKIRDNLPALKAIIQYKGTPSTPGVLSWDQFMEIGKQESDDALEERLRRICVNQCCTLIYTSGTTGPPKGVMLSHDNIVFTALSMSVMLKMTPGSEIVVSYLPLSHVAAQLADIYMTMINAGTAYFAQPDALKGSLVNTLKEVRPTAFLGVPRVWEKIYERMMDVGRKTKGLKRSIATWAKALGLEANERKQNADFSKPLGFSVANAVVFKKIKQVLGLDRCNIFLSGAAPIAPDIVRYFHSLNICLVEIYGMSESSGPHTSGIETAFKVGSAGRTMPGSMTKIQTPDAEGNGEVCMAGRNVAMGYLLKEEATNETFDDDGWLHSGDIGKIDNKGFLFITGRLKELIITAGGENIPPVLIEDLLKAELPCISNAMLIGDKRKFLSILLTLKTDMNLDTGEALDTLSPACVEWCQGIGSNARTIYDVLSGPDAKIMRAIQDGIDRTNKNAASNAQKIQKWTILPRDFTVVGDELGPTMKLKRPVVAKKYSETIERFYE
ncbi:long-chain-fatty-acid--CoA ligase ACSBG2 isoform X2 [Hyalella azteca]|uniref:long-chain-fatty-acid--CoA ligase n=1 Tax=Hyalella azteca TaxID=294128 RepID=A0A8B7NX65_HYAAZ|nr:long-chain-fatty-acid--CoA ligase ACSBG2 isoform X2 [Hyalella azteca]